MLGCGIVGDSSVCKGFGIEVGNLNNNFKVLIRWNGGIVCWVCNDGGDYLVFSRNLIYY